MSTPVDVAAHLSIGEVLSRLRSEFPDITISKIRFLESEGLVEPQRSPSGYRQFSPADVERLSYVLRAQRDQYLPLRVIKERLDALDRGAPVPAGPAAPPLGDRLAALLADADAQTPAVDGFAPDQPEVRLTRDELIRLAGIEPAALNELESYGLITLSERDGHYDADALHIVITVAGLGAFGLEPRHLRLFRTAADRHLGLIEAVVAPLGPGRGGIIDPSRAAEVGREVAALSVRLHAALVRAGLSRRGETGA